MRRQASARRSGHDLPNVGPVRPGSCDVESNRVDGHRFGDRCTCGPVLTPQPFSLRSSERYIALGL
jgi:hypothetical protein